MEPVASESADSEWIVFGSARSGNGDIYALQPDTGETVLLAGSPLGEGGPRYDASRDRVVYQRFEEEPQRTVLMNGEEELFEDPNGDSAPAWSPTGEWIVYSAVRDDQEDLYLAGPDGNGERRLTDDAEVDRYPTWSPDGQSIAFARRLESGWDLHTLDVPVKGATPVRRTEAGVYLGHPAWSPDGRFIAYDTYVGEQADIAMVELATGEVIRLTDRPYNDLVPAWSRNGSHIAFGGVADEGGDWELWRVDVATRTVERLTDQPGFDGGPAFVPASALGR